MKDSQVQFTTRLNPTCGSRPKGAAGLHISKRRPLPCELPSSSTFRKLQIQFKTKSSTNFAHYTQNIPKNLSAMPATRRSRMSSGPVAKGSQKTISFGNSKVTKVNAPSSIDKDKLSSTLSKTIDLGHISSEAVVTQQARTEIERSQKEKTAEEEKAAKVTDAQIKKYWREQEAKRVTKRVHQEGLSVEEKILRLFDMSSQYGVCLHLFSLPLSGLCWGWVISK